MVSPCAIRAELYIRMWEQRLEHQWGSVVLPTPPPLRECPQWQAHWRWCSASRHSWSVMATATLLCTPALSWNTVCCTKGTLYDRLSVWMPVLKPLSHQQATFYPNYSKSVLAKLTIPWTVALGRTLEAVTWISPRFCPTVFFLYSCCVLLK